MLIHLPFGLQTHSGNRTVEQVVIEYKPAVTGANKLEMTLNSNAAVVDGEEVALEVAPFVENGRTLVPFRWIVETLGGTVTTLQLKEK